MRWRSLKSTKWSKDLADAERNPKLVWGSTLGIGGLLYLKVWLPATGIGVPCVFHELTGLYCPGCGITRSALALLHLHIPQAYRENALVFWLLPMYLIYVWAAKRRMRRTGHAMMGVMLTITVAFGILRNVPAFDWLAPIDVP